MLSLASRVLPHPTHVLSESTTVGHSRWSSIPKPNQVANAPSPQVSWGTMQSQPIRTQVLLGKATIDVGHSACLCFCLHQPKLAMVHPVGFVACCKVNQDTGAAWVGWKVEYAVLGQ